MNNVERRTGFDLNGDGYIGGQGRFCHWSSSHVIIFVCIGFLSKLERKTHIDFNGDNIIGRRPDVYYGGYPGMYGGGYPSMGYGGYGYGGNPYGYY